MADEPKVERGYKVVVFSIATGEKLIEMSVDESVAGDAHELVDMLIKSHQKRKRRLGMKLED